jgi:hypothetical protein
MSSRLKITLIGLAGLFILYTIVWLFAADRLQRELALALETARERGIAVEAEWKGARGFPLAIVVETPVWSVATMSGLRWTGEGLTVRFRPWRPFTLTAELDGAHRLSALLWQQRTVSGDIAGGRIEAPFDAESLTLAAAGLSLRENDETPIAIENLSVQLAVEPALPAQPNRTALMDWSAQGGRVLVQRANGAVDASRFSATGWIGVDPAFRPTGQTQLELTAYGPMLRAFAARGWIDTQNLPMIEVALAWLSVPDAQTGAPVLKLPLTAENGVLAFGPVTLTTLEPLF